MTRRHTLLIALTASLSLAACDGVEEASLTAEEIPACDPGACPPPDPTPEPTEPEETTTDVSLCAPTAVAYDASVIPTLPDTPGFVESLCDQPVPLTGTPLGYDRWTYDDTARQLTHERQEQSGGWSETSFELDDAGAPRVITTSGVAGFYVSETGTTRYELDADGRLLRKLATSSHLGADTPHEQLEKVQRWDGDRLLERVERDALADRELRRYTWRYDDSGHLTQATLEDAERGLLQEALWRYDDDGRPTRVTRTVQGHVILEERWRYDAEGELEARSYYAAPRAALAAELDLEAEGLRYQGGLDDLEPTPTDWLSGNVWSNALSTEADGCRSLPRGPGHGYPAGEGDHYALGVAAGGRPGGIGFAYGYNGYGWHYGDHAWFGHGGVATLWPGIEPHALHEAIDNEVRYDARGRAIGETLTLTDPEGAVRILERTRSFGAQGLTEDTLDVILPERSARRSLRFTYDDRGHLARRDLEDGTGQLIASQSWSRDEAGRPTRHALTFDGPPSDLLNLADPIRDSWMEPSGLTEITWRYDAEGRIVERGTDAGHHQTLRYDAEGRLVETVGGFTVASSQRDTWRYDDAGHLIEHCTVAGDWTRCEHTPRDAIGRILSEEQRDASSLISTHTFAYRCN